MTVPAPDNSISVIVPNYNHGRYIGRAIKAILEQELPPYEIIIVDDGSTDGSLATIDEIAAACPLVKVIKSATNEGVVAAQMRALAVATGRYVHLAAADDTTLRGFYALAIDMLKSHPQAGFFTGDSLLYDGITGRFLSIRPIVVPSFKAAYLAPEKVRDALVRSDNWILTGASIIRRDALNDCGSLRAELGSFADGFVMRKIALTYGYCYSPTSVSTWTIFPASASRSTALNVEKGAALQETAFAHIAADPAFPRWYPARFSDRWQFATARLALHRDPIDIAMVTALGAKSDADRTALTLILKTFKGVAGRFVAATWLYFRLKPYRLRDLIATYVYRRLFCAARIDRSKP